MFSKASKKDIGQRSLTYAPFTKDNHVLAPARDGVYYLEKLRGSPGKQRGAVDWGARGKNPSDLNI
jgi:hypothetical protein